MKKWLHFNAYFDEKLQGKRPMRIYAQSLKESEVEILKLIAEGKHNKEAAKALNKSIRTIATEINSIKNKLEANTLAQAVFKACQLEILQLN